MQSNRSERCPLCTSAQPARGRWGRFSHRTCAEGVRKVVNRRRFLIATLSSISLRTSSMGATLWEEAAEREGVEASAKPDESLLQTCVLRHMFSYEACSFSSDPCAALDEETLTKWCTSAVPRGGKDTLAAFAQPAGVCVDLANNTLDTRVSGPAQETNEGFLVPDSLLSASVITVRWG
ncbi:unnamed protein product [Phaeothamnion confervicola]